MHYKVYIQISIDGIWHDAAWLEFTGNLEQGMCGATIFSYLDDYVFAHLENSSTALSLSYQVNFEVHSQNHWPAFLLDLMPSGAHRRFWASELGIPQGAVSDWQFLSSCAMNPPGNLRIKEAASEMELLDDHLGFSREDVIRRKEDLLEFMRHNGAPVGGSSGAQGDAPKFLMTEGLNERWYPSAIIPEKKIKTEWLVKFARGRKDIDRHILYAEKVYLDIAKQMGCDIFQELIYEDACLFIPRFDVHVRDERLIRCGVETIASTLGHFEFAMQASQEEVLQVIRRFSTNAKDDIKEWLRRDILNVCLGNTDNHLRNSAFIKSPNADVRLSPLYDFAPMALDPEGIVRVTRWKKYENASIPNWHLIVENYCENEPELHRMIHDILEKMGKVSGLLEEKNVHPEITNYVTEKVKIVRSYNENYA
ncbi:MAG: type II toxin-antitoxin system HipA family toxin [Lentisphaeria bacterium]|nr:type II toxin-antitoxin system HipA family toxin [Lentisphaeria bacterium]